MISPLKYWSELDYTRLLWFNDVNKENPEIVPFHKSYIWYKSLSIPLNGVIKIHAEKYVKTDRVFAVKVFAAFLCRRSK